MPESCRADIKLHEALAADVLRLVGRRELAALKDADARENCAHFVSLRDALLQAWLLALWRSGPERLARLVSLFRLEFEDSAEMRADVAGKPVYLGLMAMPEQTLRLTPQNLLLNLPLAPTRALAAPRGAGPLGS